MASQPRAADPAMNPNHDRRAIVATSVLAPILVVGLTLAAFLVVPAGHEGVEGGPVDHNWGGHAWTHANGSWILGLWALVLYRARRFASLRDSWDHNPFLVATVVLIIWGAAGFVIDGVLTAFVGDDTTWTHEFVLQAVLQFPFLLGAPAAATAGGVWAKVRGRRSPAVGPGLAA